MSRGECNCLIGTVFQFFTSILDNVLYRIGREHLSALGKAQGSLESKWKAKDILRFGRRSSAWGITFGYVRVCQVGVKGSQFPPQQTSVVLCTGSWKGIDNMPVFWLLPSSAGTTSVLSLQHFPHRWARSWEETQPGPWTQTDQRGIPCHRASAHI